MKKSKFSEEQFATALRQIDAGAPVLAVTRKLGISLDKVILQEVLAKKA